MCQVQCLVTVLALRMTALLELALSSSILQQIQTQLPPKAGHAVHK